MPTTIMVEPVQTMLMPGFFAICSFVCESREAFETAFFPHMPELQGDAPNYTDVQPVIQFSEPLAFRG